MGSEAVLILAVSAWALCTLIAWMNYTMVMKELLAVYFPHQPQLFYAAMLAAIPLALVWPLSLICFGVSFRVGRKGRALGGDQSA